MNKIGLFVIPIKIDNSISTYNDYLDFLSQAEDHGYTHIYIGEHLTDSKEDIQSSLIFAAALLSRTKKITICLCVLPIPHYVIKLLIKQLEDLYRLSQGRLQIGFSRGALKTDAEYLGFDHFKRGEYFSDKFNQLMSCISQSKYLNNLPRKSFFSTLLSPFPLKASTLFDNGYSAITSNFVNEDLWSTHIDCFLKNKSKSNTNIHSNWHLAINIIPKDSLSIKSKDIIMQSLLYIYQKLNDSELNVMLPNMNNNLTKSSELLDNLYSKMTYSTLPDIFFDLKVKYKDVIGYPIINIFDCLNDPCYCDFIWRLPKDERLRRAGI